MKHLRSVALLTFTVVLVSGLASASVSISLSPSAAQLETNQQVQFVPTVTGTTDDVVLWSLSGDGCTGITCGEISADGLYTAPAKAPSPPNVTVTATSLADLTVFATATVTIGSPSVITVFVTPSQTVIGVNGHQQFSVNVTGTANTAVIWSISGVGCSGFSCGSISSTGLYTAPAAVPIQPSISVKAVSVADRTKSGLASVVVESASAVSITILPKIAQVSTGGQIGFSATVAGTTNTSVTWSVSGAGCAGATCGNVSSAGVYTAPAVLPNPPTVTVKATAVADPSASASATVTLVASASFTVFPASSQLKPGAQLQFTAIISGSSSPVVTWSASGAACSGIACGRISSTGLYTAPATAPNPPFVAITATLVSDPTKSASALVTISSGSTVSISISPTSAQLGTGAQKQFTAVVTGSSNTAVNWGIAGIGCAGNVCGTVSSKGVYTAPATVPNPSFFNLTATAAADPSKSASATITVVPLIGISISPTSAQLAPGKTKQFSAAVTGSLDQTVIWSISGTGCRAAACGTVSPAGLYTAPSAIPNPPTVTVTATAEADSTKSAQATVRIVVPVSVMVSPTVVVVTVGTKRQFQATVTGATNTAVTWSVSGSGCSESSCGVITSDGLYTAPATVPNPPAVKITATSQADSSASDSATASIVPTNNSKLKGQYAFLFKGFDSAGVYQAAGSITADGNGNVISGMEDINRTSGPKLLAITGTYQVGGDNRGTLTLNTTNSTSHYTFALNSTGKIANFVEADATGVRGSGVLKSQDPMAFDPSALASGYAISLTGADVNGGRIGAVGSIFPSGSGVISGSSLDVVDGGIPSPTFATFSGIYDVSLNGRGTATLAIPGFGGGTFDFALYIVSASEFVLLSTDPLSSDNPIFGGWADIQSGLPFATSSFRGFSVVDLTALHGASPQVTVGRMYFDGSGNVTVQLDQNDGGAISIGVTLTGAYSIQLNGRGVLNLDNSETGAQSTWIFYATARNGGFLLDISSGAVGVGELQAQAVAAPFESGDLEGTFAFGSGEPATSQVPLVSGVETFDGASKVSGTEDENRVSGFTPNLPIVGTYSISFVSNNGRGVIMQTSPASQTQALWLVSGLGASALDVDPGAVTPALIVFEQ